MCLTGAINPAGVVVPRMTNWLSSTLVQTWVFGIGGIVIGVIATMLASRYYFRRSIRPRLALYRQFETQVLKGIDPAVRGDLTISYQGEEIEDMTKFRFIVANTGDLSIANCLRPLTLVAPPHASILDASVLHVNPEGREVAARKTQTSDGRAGLELSFPLLNAQEWFLVEVLLKGSVSKEDLLFTIAAEGIPPRLALEPAPSDALKPRIKQWPAVPVGLSVMALGFSEAFLLFRIHNEQPEIFPIPWQSYNQEWIVLPGVIVFSLTPLATILTGVIFASVPLLGLGKRTIHFSLPEHLRSRVFPMPENEMQNPSVSELMESIHEPRR